MTSNRETTNSFNDEEQFHSEADRKARDTWNDRMRRAGRKGSISQKGKFKGDTVEWPVTGKKLGMFGRIPINMAGKEICTVNNQAQTQADQQETRAIETYALHLWCQPVRSFEGEPDESWIVDTLQSKISEMPDLTTGTMDFGMACDSLLESLGVITAQDKQMTASSSGYTE